MLLGSYRVGVLASETKRYLSFNILTPRRTEQQTIQDKKKGVSFSKLQFSLLDIGQIDKYSNLNVCQGLGSFPLQPAAAAAEGKRPRLHLIISGEEKGGQ